MNKKIDLTKILKDCPKGFKLYSTIYGEVKFRHIVFSAYPIIIENDNGVFSVTKHGMHIIEYEDKAECILFPSKEQRDWSKFTAPWYKKEKFDPKTFQPFDKVLVKINNEYYNTWYADFVAEPSHVKNETPLVLGAKEVNIVIPYNDETKHLVGTTEEAPEYYRYWND